MKTDFPIVWVDDNKPFVESLTAPLNDWVEEHGFELKVDYYKSSAGIVGDLRNKEVELVIVDLNLPGKKGDKIIEEIRAKQYYHDIIFYSQGGIPHDSFTTPPDGVFFVDRTDAKQRIKDLIKLKIRRASDLATLRGWIVADAIELEQTLGRVLSKCFHDMEAMFHRRVLLEENLFDCGKKQRVLSGILKDFVEELKTDTTKADKMAQVAAHKKILDAFPEEVIDVRNALAHQVAEDGAAGEKAVRTRNKKAALIELTETGCAKIRKNLRRHQANLAELLTLV